MIYMLYKMAVQVLLNVRSLGAQTVVAKYKFHGSRYNYRKPNKSSQIWSNITLFGSTAQNHIIWEIGVGESINLLKDPWMVQMPVSNWPNYLNVNNDGSTKSVRYVITPNRKWNREEQTNLFPQDMIDAREDGSVRCMPS